MPALIKNSKFERKKTSTMVGNFIRNVNETNGQHTVNVSFFSPLFHLWSEKENVKQELMMHK